MTEIQVLIVDDEPVARRGLRRYLEKQTSAHIVGECADGREAVSSILTIQPDLVFLDIQMPEVDGFSVIREVGTKNMPAVIFITAYDEYALQAFEAHALDYLLKPIDEERLRTAYERAADRIRRDQKADLHGQFQKVLSFMTRQPHEKSVYSDTRLVIKGSGRIYFLDAFEVQWIEAAGNYVLLHVNGKEHLMRETMQNLEDRLGPFDFVRINRSLLVNLRFVRELRPRKKGIYVILLKNGSRLTSSRHYRTNLDRILKG